MVEVTANLNHLLELESLAQLEVIGYGTRRRVVVFLPPPLFHPLHLAQPDHSIPPTTAVTLLVLLKLLTRDVLSLQGLLTELSGKLIQRDVLLE